MSRCNVVARPIDMSTSRVSRTDSLLNVENADATSDLVSTACCLLGLMAAYLKFAQSKVHLDACVMSDPAEREAMFAHSYGNIFPRF
jgi:hypothetical protein